MVWHKIKSGKGALWSYVVYESDDSRSKNRYKTVWKPTAKCKREWKKYGAVAKTHTKYHNTFSEVTW